MDTIDSRTLGYFDCFFRPFTTPGRSTYSIAPAGLHPAGGRFAITVGERPGRTPQQHDVVVRLRDGRLEPDRAEMEIAGAASPAAERFHRLHRRAVVLNTAAVAAACLLIAPDISSMLLSSRAMRPDNRSRSVISARTCADKSCVADSS